MPIVRRTQREVSLQPLQGGMMRAAATALSEGADVERAKGEQALAMAGTFERLGRIGIENYTRIKKDQFDAANETAALNYSNALASWKAKRVDGPEGAMSLKGESSFQLPEDLLAEYDDIAGTEASKATNAEQARAFAKIRSQERQQLDLQVNRHVAREMEAYHAQVLEHAVVNTVQSAIAAYRDPKLVDVELSKAVGAIEGSAKRMGWGPDAVAMKTREVTTTTHLGVISNLLAEEKTDQAEFYFQQKAGAIDASKHDEVKGWLETASVRKQGQLLADEIIGKGGTMTDQLEEAKRRFETGQVNAKVREDAEQRIRQHRTDVDRERLESDRKTQMQAYNILDSLGPAATTSKIPPALWNSFEGGTRASLESYAAHKRKGESIETDYITYTELWTMARKNPAAFLKENLLDYRGELSDGDFERMLSLQYQIGTAPEKAEKDLSGFASRKSIVDDTLTLYGINPNVPATEGNSAQAQSIAQLRRIVDTQVEYEQQKYKKELTNAEVQAIVDRVLIQTVNTPSSYWQWLPGGMSPGEPIKKRMIDATIDDVPADIRARIEKSLRGRHYDDQRILDEYFALVMSGKVR